MDQVYSNIFYFKKICKIGGTEQFLYEIAKKYHGRDITIFYNLADSNQLERLKKFVRCIKYVPGQKVKCKKAFFNFNIDMIDDVEADKYVFISHANYEELGYKPPIEHPKLTHFIGVSEFATAKLNEYGEKIKMNIKAERCYNPLTIDKVKKPVVIVSACRLDDKVKGGQRTLNLIAALDRYCEKNNTNYIWLIFSNPVKINIDSPNVIIMKPRINVRPYIANADYIAQLSNDMETFCYTTNEALSYGVPIITTPLSINKELPITNNELIQLDWNCENVDEVARQVFEKRVKPFQYKAPADNWNDLLIDIPSNYDYEKEKRKMKKIKVIKPFSDMYDGTKIKKNDVIVVENNRADRIIKDGYGVLIEEIEEQKIVLETATTTEKKETKVRKVAKK